ncbi:protein takeout-like [Thrips palmi]|uniref:Protein takeout-like n=1 Tax=Thrips palmi TaxID=161013 RepID=A0A6P8YH27_THRPL|nr:protein takeout-like [Thrips palmi]
MARPEWLLVAVAAMVLSTVPTAQAASKLPSNFKRCAAADPKFNECLRGAVEDAFHKMVNGVPSLGVLPVDPLKVDRIKINQGGGSVSLNMDLRNITITGLADTKMLNYSANLADATLDTASLTRSLRLEFDHVITGRLLLLPIRGAGPGSITLTQLLTGHKLKFVPKMKKDNLYWNIQDYYVKFVPKNISIDFQGLFSDGRGDANLGEQLNRFMNQNAFLIFEEIGSAFEEAFSGVVKEVTHRVFSRVPIADIFVLGKKA